MTAAQIEQEDACIPNELMVPCGLNPDALPFITSPGIRHRDSLEDRDSHYDSTAAPPGTMPEGKKRGHCLEFVDLFPDVGLNQPLNRSRLLTLFYAGPELRALSSRQIRIPNHDEKKKENNCEDWSWVVAVLAGDS
ncbi:hypothetical protein NDU88_005593 [Pleurodeles waltl]|uniref:Uncharacterized protein n=1 Tax=Pleurodeles waltl TaxID=8319 RepID=A0AAV7WYB3_PLEWA|nr:hypothetical protein NDU88_005593 [Pleurodeles waltl]